MDFSAVLSAGASLADVGGVILAVASLMVVAYAWPWMCRKVIAFVNG